MTGLARFTRPVPAPPADAACELCDVAIATGHRHVVDLDAGTMACVCRGCALLFLSDAGLRGRYRTVPEEHRRLDPFVLAPSAWAGLQVPVGIVFVVRHGASGELAASYPSPGGATRASLPPGAWDDVVAANPALADVAADVEAVLVRTAQDAPGRPDTTPERPECWIVGVDRC